MNISSPYSVEVQYCRGPSYSPGRGHEYSPGWITSIPHLALGTPEGYARESNGFSSSLQLFGKIFLRHFFANGFAFELNLTGLMGQAIQDRAGDDGIGKDSHPIGHGAIAG